MSSKQDINKKTENKHEIRDGQSIDLLKELHILTRDGKLNQDSRRKLKQVYHLYQFIEPLMQEIINRGDKLTLVDHGAGKSYLGFILYDLFVNVAKNMATIYGIENRSDLVDKSTLLAQQLKFSNMKFLHLNVADSIHNEMLPNKINIVTALHACNTATDDAIDFALTKKVDFIVIVPCCQAEVAEALKNNRNTANLNQTLSQIWRHPIHAREFGSHITNVLRCLRLEAHGYSVTATELIGWEHSMKNELIIAKKTNKINYKSLENLNQLLEELALTKLAERFKIIA